MARARTIVLVLRAPVSRADANWLHEAVRRQALDDDAALVVCQVSGPTDVGVVDALARIALLARRSNLAVRVRCDNPLLHLCGLDEVLPACLPPPVPS